MFQSSGSRGDSMIPKITAASPDYDVYVQSMESYLRGHDLFSVAIHPVAKGSIAERAKSKGRQVVTAKDVDDSTVKLFLEMEGDAL